MPSGRMAGLFVFEVAKSSAETVQEPGVPMSGRADRFAISLVAVSKPAARGCEITAQRGFRLPVNLCIICVKQLFCSCFLFNTLYIVRPSSKTRCGENGQTTPKLHVVGLKAHPIHPAPIMVRHIIPERTRGMIHAAFEQVSSHKYYRADWRVEADLSRPGPMLYAFILSLS